MVSGGGGTPNANLDSQVSHTVTQTWTCGKITNLVTKPTNTAFQLYLGVTDTMRILAKIGDFKGPSVTGGFVNQFDVVGVHLDLTHDLTPFGTGVNPQIAVKLGDVRIIGVEGLDATLTRLTVVSDAVSIEAQQFQAGFVLISLSAFQPHPWRMTRKMMHLHRTAKCQLAMNLI